MPSVEDDPAHGSCVERLPRFPHCCWPAAFKVLGGTLIPTTESGRQAVAPAASSQMGKKAPKVVEGRSQQQRKAVRKNLGKLKDLTVQPRTRQRYEASLQQFFSWLEREGLALPTRVTQMDNLVCDYLEFLWAEGHGKSEANNALAALQDFDPNLRRKLPGSWRLLKAWSTAEIPNRAPPMTLGVLDALCGWSVTQGKPEFGLSLRLAFFGLLRTEELLSLTNKDVYITSPKGPAVIFARIDKVWGSARSQ